MQKVFGEFVAGRAAVGLLLVRLVFGLGMALHGYPKVFGDGGPFAWMGPGAPVPGFLQALAALAEFGGGLALMAGLLTPLASLGMIATMLVAITTVHLKQGHSFVAAPGQPSYETAALYLAVAVLALVTGPGALSVDALLFGKKRERAVAATPLQVVS